MVRSAHWYPGYFLSTFQFYFSFISILFKSIFTTWVEESLNVKSLCLVGVGKMSIGFLLEEYRAGNSRSAVESYLQKL